MFVRTLNIQVPYPIQFSDNPNTIELYPILTNEQFAYEFAKSKKLIYDSIICNCGRIMQIQKNNSFKCCECFACKCGMKASIFTFSYFMYSKISINIEMHIIYCWALEYSVKNAFAEIQIGYNTISSRFKQLREACLGYLSGQNQPVIGGKNKTVEIDETCISHRKYNRGRLISEVWIFGGICREDNQVFAVVVPDRTWETLFNEIIKHVAPGTRIYSDSWRAYRGIDKFEYEHFTVDHSKNFVDPQTKCHTQHIERLWKELKKPMKRYEGTRKENVKRYLGEFLWRRNEINGISPFYAALKLLSDTHFIPNDDDNNDNDE